MLRINRWTLFVLQYGYYQCLCVPRYGGQQCQRRCNRTIDVAIVLEMSGGIDNPDPMTSFAQSIISGLSIGVTQSHVSVMTFSDEAFVLFHLNNYTSTQQVSLVLRLHIQVRLLSTLMITPSLNKTRLYVLPSVIDTRSSLTIAIG